MHAAAPASRRSRRHGSLVRAVVIPAAGSVIGRRRGYQNRIRLAGERTVSRFVDACCQVPRSIAVPRRPPVTLPSAPHALGPTRLHHLAQTWACLRCGSRVGARRRRPPRACDRTRHSAAREGRRVPRPDLSGLEVGRFTCSDRQASRRSRRHGSFVRTVLNVPAGELDRPTSRTPGQDEALGDNG